VKGAHHRSMRREPHNKGFGRTEGKEEIRTVFRGRSKSKTMSPMSKENAGADPEGVRGGEIPALRHAQGGRLAEKKTPVRRRRGRLSVSPVGNEGVLRWLAEKGAQLGGEPPPYLGVRSLAGRPRARRTGGNYGMLSKMPIPRKKTSLTEERERTGKSPTLKTPLSFERQW